jgi:hypothetical protein
MAGRISDSSQWAPRWNDVARTTMSVLKRNWFEPTIVASQAGVDMGLWAHPVKATAGQATGDHRARPLRVQPVIRSANGLSRATLANLHLSARQLRETSAFQPAPARSARLLRDQCRRTRLRARFQWRLCYPQAGKIISLNLQQMEHRLGVALVRCPVSRNFQ